jgi:hypothetical protein
MGIRVNAPRFLHGDDITLSEVKRKQKSEERTH